MTLTSHITKMLKKLSPFKLGPVKSRATCQAQLWWNFLVIYSEFTWLLHYSAGHNSWPGLLNHKRVLTFCFSKMTKVQAFSRINVYSMLLALQVHLLSFSKHLVTPATVSTAGVVVLVPSLWRNTLSKLNCVTAITDTQTDCYREADVLHVYRVRPHIFYSNDQTNELIKYNTELFCVRRLPLKSNK